jgi:hypothetical protein
MNRATALIVNESTGCTLYELEDNLQALVNSIDLAQEPIHSRVYPRKDRPGGAASQKKAGCRRRVSASLQISTGVCRRGNRAHSKAQSIHRACPRGIGIVLDSGGRTVCRPPNRRGIQRLDGNFSSLRIQRNPESVLISDIEAVPPAFKQIILTMPAYVWTALLQ